MVCVIYIISPYKVDIIILISQKKLSLKEDMSFPQGH